MDVRVARLLVRPLAENEYGWWAQASNLIRGFWRDTRCAKVAGASESWILPGDGLSLPLGEVSPAATCAVGLLPLRPAYAAR